MLYYSFTGTLLSVLIVAFSTACNSNAPPPKIHKTPECLVKKNYCESSDSADYQHVKSDFYRHKHGTLYEKKRVFSMDTCCDFTFGYDSLLGVPYEHGERLQDVIDIPSFVDIDSTWYSKDKQYVYSFYDKLDGGIRMIVEAADPKTFRKLSNCHGHWGIDKNHLFYRGNMLKNLNVYKLQLLPTDNHYVKDDKFVFYQENRIDGADTKTFKLVEKKPTFDAMDKNYKYLYGKRCE